MTDKTIPHKKILLICGITCAISGLIIFAVTIFDDEPISYGTIGLGIINVINGCLFIGLSRQPNRKS